jgi:NAD-dependent deacetylase
MNIKPQNLMKQRIVFLTGAGMSAESGISTFRDSDGLWARYRVEEVCTHEAWLSNPKLLLQFYNDRRREFMACKPNEGHRIIAEMERDFDVQVVTQNVDNLHEQAGSTHVLHLHGELMKSRSDRDESRIYDIDPQHPDLHWGDVDPYGDQLRPHIVFFGEAVPNLEAAAALVRQADILVVIGTSLNVYPAAGLTAYARRGIPLYLIDPKEVNNSRGLPFIHIQLGASQGMVALRKLLTV